TEDTERRKHRENRNKKEKNNRGKIREWSFPARFTSEFFSVFSSLCILCVSVVRFFSNPSELPFEVVPAEEQRRRPAVRTVVHVVGEGTLVHQGAHFLGREPVARADGGVTGHQA